MTEPSMFPFSLALRAALNRARRRLAHALLHRRVFGECSKSQLLAHTRISPSSWLEHEERLALGDHVYIGPFNWIEASGGIEIGEGVQITSHCSIVTHSSHRAARLMGRAYADAAVAPQPGRPGWVAGPVVIGAYSFVGPQVLIEPGTRLGRGTLVRAGSVVRGEFPDFAVLEGRPARVVGDTREADAALLAQHPAWRGPYEAWAGSQQPAPGGAALASPAGGAEPPPDAPR
jgi:acetyltransferase-like isoleucine patch superfamily enzyme